MRHLTSFNTLLERVSEKTESLRLEKSGSNAFGLLTVALLLVTFAIDLATPNGIASWAFYTIAVVMALYWKGRRAVVAVVLVTMILIVLGGWLGSTGDPAVGFVNRSLGVGTIALLGWLCLYIDQKNLLLRIAMAARRESEEALQAREQQQAAVASLGQQALSGLDLAALLDEAVKVVARTLVVEYSKALELLPAGHAFRVVAGVGWKQGVIGQAIVDAGPASHAGFTLQSREPVIVTDLRTESRFRGMPLLHDHGVISGMSIIIEGQDRPFGVLCAHSTKPRTFTYDAVHFLQAVANVLAQAIQRKRAEAALRENEERMRAILDSALDAVIGMDEQGRITDWNQRAEAIFGWTQSEAIGRTLSETIIPPQFREAHRRGLQHFLTTGEGPVLNRRVEMSALRRDGKEFPVDLSVIPSKNAESYRFTAFVADITERKQAEERLKHSHEQLRNLASQLESVKEEQATRIAREIHDELGQALTGLKMDLAWLGKRLASPEVVAPRASLQEKIPFMTVLADTMIRTVRRIASELRPGVLDDLGLVAAIEWQAKEFQARTGTRCEFAIRPQEINLDRARSTAIFRIFQEILTNVVRHARATKVTITLREEAGLLILEVRDNGKGILDREISGTKSLGMLGMRERAQVVGGEVLIQGSEGRGSKVTVRIPVK